MARETIYDTIGFLGLLLPEERITADTLRTNDGAAQASDYSEAGRRAGVPQWDQAEVADVSSTAGDLGPMAVLDASGEQDATAYHVKAIRGGMPSIDDGARIIQRNGVEAGSGVSWKGSNGLQVVSCVEVDHQLEYTQSVYINYAIERTSAGTVAIALSETTGEVSIYRYDPEQRTLSSAVTAQDPNIAFTGLSDDDAVYDTRSGIVAANVVIELLKLSTGRLVLLTVVRELGYTASTGSESQLMTSYSDDDGATWRTGSYLALDTSIPDGSIVYKARACEGRPGQVLLLIEYSWDTGTTRGVLQYASDDYGTTFRLIEDWQNGSGSPHGRFFDCAADPSGSGQITVFYLEQKTSYDVKYRRIGSPFDPILSASEQTIEDQGSGDVSCIAAFAAEDGSMYCTWSASTSTNPIEMAVSRDGGETWSTYAHDVYNIWSSDDHAWDVTSVRGVAVWIMADPQGSGQGVGDPFFTIVQSGGWDNVTMPQVKGADPRQQMAYGGDDTYLGSTWLGQRDPASYSNWTAVGAGTSSQRATAPFGTTVTTTANARYYEDTTENVHDAGVLFHFSVQHQSGGNVTARNVAASIRLEDSTNGYEWEVSVRFSATQVRMVDEVGSTTIDTVSVDIDTNRGEFMLATRKWPNTTDTTTAAAALYYRPTRSSDWTCLILTADGLTRRSAGVGTSSSFVRFGALVSSTAESDWHYALVARYTGHVGAVTATAISYGFYDDLALNPLRGGEYALWGARLPALPGRRYIRGGLYVHGSSGPFFRGDAWQIAPEHDYPVEHLLPDVMGSPNVPFRTDADSVVTRIAWAPGGTNATRMGSPSWGMAAFGSNIKYADLLGESGGAWSTLGRLDFRGGMVSLNYARTGDTVAPNTAINHAGAQYIAHNELVGCTVDLGGGKLRRVVANTEGAWTSAATKRPVLTLEGVDGTEGATGTLDIWYREAVLLLHNSTAGYTAFAIQIPSHATVDGYYQIGTLVMGPAVVFGHKYSRNRTVTTSPNYELSTGEAGQRTARKLGPGRRAVEASWVEGVDTSGLFAASPVPDYLSPHASAEAFATRGDMLLLEGVIERLGGATRPCVYLPRFPAPPSSGEDANKTYMAGRERVLLVRLTDAASRQTTNGNEVLSEVVTLTGFRAEEEV